MRQRRVLHEVWAQVFDLKRGTDNLMDSQAVFVCGNRAARPCGNLRVHAHWKAAIADELARRALAKLAHTGTREAGSGDLGYRVNRPDRLMS